MVTAVEIHDRLAQDSPLLPALLDTTAKTFKVSEVSADKGYSSIAEKRCIETIQSGKPRTGFMKYGDTIRIEMKGRNGVSLFGAIEQKVVEVG